MKKFAVLFTFIFISVATQAQYIIPLIIGATMPEHGFLPGKKFQFYPTLNKFDFVGKKLCVAFFDLRDSLQIKKLDCAKVDITNESEFAGPNGAIKVIEYFQALMPQAGIVIDSAAADTLNVYLEALDNRLIGFGSITAHGLCQMRIIHGNMVKTYCEDITDKDPHSPIGRNAFVTRKTATRVIQSASIREVIEKIFADLKGYKE